MPQKRKRKRTRVKPGPILVLLVIAVFTTGIAYSKITSLTKASVIGAKANDMRNIEAILAKLNNRPYFMVNKRQVETEVQRIQAIDRCNYSQNIFGRGRLEVFYRVPIARIRAEKVIGMDAMGVMYETNELPADLPAIVRPDTAKDLPVSIMSGFASRSVADLAVMARKMAPAEKLTIWFNKAGFLCLNIGTGLVILGSCDDLDSKLRALREILDQQPDLLGKLESLNLTEPSHPAKTYKKKRE